MGPLLAFVAAFSTSEFVNAVSGTARQLVPAIMFIPFVIAYVQSLDHESGLWWLLFAALLLCNALISAMVSQFEPVRSVAFGIATWLPFCFLAFTPPDIESFSVRYFQSIAFLASIWVWYHFFSTPEEMGPYFLKLETGFGITELALVWPILFGFARFSHGRTRLLNLILTGMAMGAVFLLFSRLMLFVMIAAFLGLIFYESKAAFLLIVLAVVIALLCIPSYQIHEYLAWYRYVDFEADSSRSMIRRLAMSQVEHNMAVGIGPGNVRYALYGMNAYYGAHNTIITVALELGLFGAMMIVLFTGYTIFTAVRLFFRGGIGPYYCAGIAGLLGFSLVGDWHHKPHVSLLLIIVLINARVLLGREDDRVLNEQYRPFRHFAGLEQTPGSVV